VVSETVRPQEVAQIIRTQSFDSKERYPFCGGYLGKARVVGDSPDPVDTRVNLADQDGVLFDRLLV
jgi:hypothetical protein